MESEDDQDVRKKKGELEIAVKEAEVSKRWSEAEITAARAHKAKKEAGIEDESEEEGIGGVARDRFVTIWRQSTDMPGWKLFRRMAPLDEIGEVEDYIASEGNPEDAHKCQQYNGEGKKIGKTAFFPPREESQVGVSLSEKRKKVRDLEKKLSEKDEDEKIARLEKRLTGEDKSDGGKVFVPSLGGWFPKDHPLAQGGYAGVMPPWMQPKEDSTTAMIKALVPVLVAWIGRAPEKNPVLDMLPLVINGANKGHLEPKDMLGMFSPFVLEMSKMNAESSRTLMESMSKMDDAFRKKMLDLLMSDPSRTPDEIEKWTRWLNFGETALRKGAGVVRDALKDGDGKTPKRIENRKPAHTLPGPKKEGDPQPEGGGNKPASETQEEPAAQASDPKSDAEKLKRARVEQFLLATEEEMLAESDPVLMAGKVEEIWLCLPSSLRRKIEEAVQDDPIQDEKLLPVFTALKELCPEVTNRIGAVLVEDPDKQEWMKEYLEACAFPPDEEGEEEEDPPHEDPPDEDEQAQPAAAPE